MAKEKYVYKGRDASTVRERAEGNSGAFDSYIKDRTPTYKVKDGENNIRIMPPTWDTTDKRWGANWGITLWLHYGIGPDKSTYLCLFKMLGKPCYLCDARREIEREDEAKAKEMRPGERVLCWIIDRKDEKAGPLAYAMPRTLESEIQTRSLDKKTKAALQIDHPDEGYDVSFDKAGAQLKTKYSGEDLAREPSPLSDNPKTQEKWMEHIIEHPLTTLLVYKDNDYLKAILGAKTPASDDGDSGDGGKSKKGGKKADVPTEDDIGEMTRDQLEAVINDHELNLDLDDFTGLANKRDAVWEQLKAKTDEPEAKPKKAAKKTPVEEAEEDPEEAEDPEAEEPEKKPAGKAKGVTEDEVDEMDIKALQKVIDNNDLSVDLDDFSSLSKKRGAVWAAYEAKSQKAKPKEKAAKLPSEDEVDEMDADALEETNTTLKLKLDLDDYSSLSKKRAAVWTAIEAKAGKTKEAEDEDATAAARKGISRLKRNQTRE